MEQAAVAQISPQMLHHPLHDIPRIGGDRPPDEGPMGDREIIPRGWLRHAEGSRDLGVIQDPAGQPPQHVEKTAEPDLVEARKQPFDVAKEIGLNVLLNPPSAERGRGIEPGLREAASSQENGAISMIPTRPARLSDTDLTSAGELDPVMTNRPFSVRCSSMATRSAGRRSGRTWASSRATWRGFRRKNASGARETTAWSARRSRSSCFHLGGRVRRRVVLPHWRTPSKATQGKVAR